jgi:hypothetical protein
MTRTAADGRALQPGDADAPGPRASDATPPDIVAQRLIAVPWRHAGLIAMCMLAGGLASGTFWRHAAPVRVAATRPHVQAIQDAPSAAAPGIELRLDTEAGAPDAAPWAMQTADAAQASAMLRLDDISESDAIEAALREAPPAAGPLMGTSTGLAPGPGAERPRPSLPGLGAGLLLGLLLAALRELGGERMRSAREASWALGAPVLGAIPTLSARAREKLLEPRPAVADAA